MIPKLAMFLVRTIWTGANWVSEVFVSYFEILVRTTIYAFVAIIVADILIATSIRFDSNLLLVLGVIIGGGGLLYFTVVSSPARMAAEWLSRLSTIAKQEIERLSNIFFLIMVIIFYLGVDQGQRHPMLLKVFLGMMLLLFFVVILPGQSATVLFFKRRFQMLVLAPVVLMTIFAVTPEAVANRIIYSHGLEKATGTIAVEMAYRLNDQDQIIDSTNGQPMVFFDQIAAKDSKQPRPLIGWTQDKKNQYHLYRWFDGQINYNGMGKEIKPMTTDKLDDIITQARHEAEEKAAADAEAAIKKATADGGAPHNAVAEEEKAKQQQEKESQESQPPVNQTIETTRSEPAETETSPSEETRNEAVQENPPQPETQFIPVTVTILPPNNKFADKDLIAVRPNTQFIYQGKTIRPYQSVITLLIIDVAPTSGKDQYMITAHPRSLIVNSGFNNQSYDIYPQTESFQFLAKKDDSHSLAKIITGTAIGAGIGAIIDGKKGAIKGAAIGGGAGAVYAIASHGKTFQMPTSDLLPPVMFRPY